MAPFTPSTGFTNTSPIKPSKPTGIPDPNNPGYDTGGYRLGSSGSFETGLTIPNANGGTTTTQPGNLDTTVTPQADAGSGGTNPGDWAGLSNSIFGPMPSISRAPAFDYAQFAPPSWEDVLKSDPGIQFGINQGTGALQASAAARGVLNTGGTLKDILDYGRNAATQGYQGAFDRALQGYITNFGSALTRYNTNYGTQYLNPYAQMFSQYQQGVGNQNQLFNQQFNTATA